MNSINIPVIGMGATIQIGSDAYPATIIQITRNGKSLILQEDIAIRIDNNGMSESQKYTYESNSQGKIHIATLRKDGAYRLTGEKTLVSIGIRQKYYDYSF